MRKRIFKTFTTMCILACMLTGTRMTSHAALSHTSENSICGVTGHKYYQEVSMMAQTISEELPEVERAYLYDACMVKVFGANYRKNHSPYLSDLIRVMTADEMKSMQPGFASNLTLSGSVKYSDERWELRTVEPIPLNEEGVNERNYQELKLLYATYLEAKSQLANLDELTKIRTLHDFLIEKLDAPTQNTAAASASDDVRMHTMTAALADHVAYCNVYSNLFYLLGTSNGLTIKIDQDHINHACNYVFIDGKRLSMDVMHDDITNSTRYYLTNECARKHEHTLPEP